MASEDAANGDGPRRVLLVANRTCPCPELLDAVSGDAGQGGEVFLVAPAMNSSRIAHWVSDTDEALTEARERIEMATAGLAERGVVPHAEVGDAHPLQAVEDAVHAHRPHEIVIGTHPPGDSHWLERNLVEDVRARYDVPVRHIVTEYGLDAG